MSSADPILYKLTHGLLAELVGRIDARYTLDVQIVNWGSPFACYVIEVILLGSPTQSDWMVAQVTVAPARVSLMVPVQSSQKGPPREEKLFHYDYADPAAIDQLLTKLLAYLSDQNLPAGIHVGAGWERRTQVWIA